MLIFIPAASSAGSLSITVATNKPQYSPGDVVSVSGKVQDSQSNAVAGAIISIQINNPPAYVQTANSDSSGAYSVSFTLAPTSTSGQYTVYVTATSPGYTNGQSQTQFTVAGQPVSSTTSASTSSQTSTQPQSKCLIATATYGSELSPEVAMLRDFRDSEILRTYAGANFMTAFNAFYYSFSPQVASYITSHALLRSAMKVILYPLIGILYVADRLLTVLSFNMELAVTIAGIFAGVAIGLVYALPLAVAFSTLISSKRRVIRRGVVCEILLSEVLSIAGLIGAEVFRLETLMVVSSSIVILSSLALGALIAARLSCAVALRKIH